MPVIRNASFTDAVELYVNHNDDWMTDSDAMLVTALFKSAAVLDQRVTASLLGEFRQVLRELHKRKPGLPLEQKLDEFDELIKDFT